jgi:hypothetical protein
MQNVINHEHDVCSLLPESSEAVPHSLAVNRARLMHDEQSAWRCCKCAASCLQLAVCHAYCASAPTLTVAATAARIDCWLVCVASRAKGMGGSMKLWSVSPARLQQISM